MEKYDITIARIRNKNNLNDSRFLNYYERLLLNDLTLSYDEKFFLLRIAVLFLKSVDSNIALLGYRMILKYSILFKDFKPLYDVALGKDYIPITKFIELRYWNELNIEDSFSGEFLSSYQESFKIPGDKKNTYRSLGQMELSEFSTQEANIAVIAPTSYGKSEMIIRKVSLNLNKRICIIVPSKALLAQTKKLLIGNSLIKSEFKKIVTHPDMYRDNEPKILAVLTQERLLRLLQRNKTLAFDLVLVDEAHNLLENSERAHLLAQVLLILQSRNKSFLVNFFTPFLVDSKSLSIKNHSITSVKDKPIKERMKIERFYACDISKKKVHLYDQFLNKTFLVTGEIFTDEIDFIDKNKAYKNIIYLNRPLDTEKFALEFANRREAIPLSQDIQSIINSIGKFIHPKYNLIYCIKHGVLYHHGGIPDIVRLYVEEIFSKQPAFDCIISTSTLLEGVNIPAEKIFILSPKKGNAHLTASQFKNLIGRVCRFKEAFDPNTGNLRMLEPEIYLMKGRYTKEDFSLFSFYEGRVNTKLLLKDDVKNPLLENTKSTKDTERVLEYLENIEIGSSGLTNVVNPISELGKLCFTNNIHDFEIISNEETLLKNLEYYQSLGLGLINNSEALIKAIVVIFFDNISLFEKSDNVRRLKDNVEARNFYAMFLGWRSQGTIYPVMIASFLSYWKKLEEQGENMIFVGSKWGDKKRGGYQNLFVDISEKSDTERVNLAIAKIKEEQEFIEFNIIKYLEILNELKMVQTDFYDQIKYGTTDKYIISMLKNGISFELAQLLKSKYYTYFTIDTFQDLVEVDPSVVQAMRDYNENEILIFEVTCYI